MIRLEKTGDDVATLAGAPAEVMVFYCAWQSNLWPDWMSSGELERSNDESIQQHKRVLGLIAAGDVVSLCTRGELLQKALKVAEDFCGTLGIIIQIREASQV